MKSHFRFSSERMPGLQDTLDSVGRKRKASPNDSLFDQRRSISPKCRQATGISLPKVTSPAEYALQVFKENGFNVVEELHVSFVAPTEQQIVAYQTETVRAVQTGSIEQLRVLHESGVSLDCCNRFGESLVSMACRRGNVDVVRFLVEEAKVSLFLLDDLGRTVLHDAFWTVEPKFDLVEFLLEIVPDLLCVNDRRGHAPLNYIRREDWDQWNVFLNKQRHMLSLKLSKADKRILKLTEPSNDYPE